MRGLSSPNYPAKRDSGIQRLCKYLNEVLIALKMLLSTIVLECVDWLQNLFESM